MTENTDTLSPEVLADLKAKSLGEKFFDARKAAKMTHMPSWQSLMDHERSEHENAGLAMCASLSHDETATATIQALRTALEEANSGLHGVMEAGRQEIALLRARAEKAETALAEARRQIAERDEALLSAAKYLVRMENALLKDDLDMKLDFPGEEGPSAFATTLVPDFDVVAYELELFAGRAPPPTGGAGDPSTNGGEA